MPYCRRCIKFSKKDVDIHYNPTFKTPKNVVINLKYPLSSFQENISNSLVKDIKSNDNLLVYAVCGAGKTEIIIKVIQEYLKKGDKGILNLFIIETRTAVTKHKNQIEEGFFKY